MAITESVKIVFEVDSKPLADTVTQLAAIGKVSQEDAAKLNALTTASKAAGDSLSNASKGAKQFSDASKDIAKSTSEVAKSAGELKSVAPSIGAAGTAAKTAGDGFISLRTRLKEAKDELARLSDEFGEFSPQANAARARAGQLADQMSDLNRQVGLLNPESKIQAFSKFGQGIVGAFQVATGALQAFGAENEEVQKIAQKLQGALNVVQGLQSIVQLKEAYSDVKAVLGFTTAAQNTLTTATTAGAAATDGAALSARGFGAALSATGIGAIVVAIGALAGAFLLLRNNEKDATEEADKLLAKQKELTAETEKTIRAEEDLAIAKDPSKKIEIEKARAIREGSTALREQQKEYNAINNQIKNNEALNRDAEARIKALSGSTREAAVVQIQSLQEAIDRRNKENESLIVSRDLTQSTIIQIKNRVAATKSLIDEENKATDAADNYNDKIDDRIAKERSAFEEARKLREFNIELNKLYGASEEDILRQKIFNNQADQEALDAILSKAKGTAEYDQIQSQLNDKVREEILLRKQLENQLEVQKIALKGIETQQEKNNETAKEAVPIAKEVGETATDLNNQMFARDDAQKEQFKVYKELAKETFDFIFDLQNQRFEDEQTQLDKQREQNLITEEQYQEAVLQLRKRQAQADKNSAIFNASIGLAEAIVKALNAPPPISFQSVALASAIAAAQLAKIIATPLPKFKKGTLSVPGADSGDDSVMAMLRPGEAVIPTEMNREYAPTIRAIYNRKVSSSDLNDFVNSRMSVVRDEPVFNFNPVTLDALYKRDLRVSRMSSALSRSGGSMPSINVKADVDTYALGKVIGKNKSMEVTNVESIGEAVAEALSRRTNRRQQI